MGTTARETGSERAQRIRENIAAYKAAIAKGTHTPADLNAYLQSEQVAPDVRAEMGAGDTLEDVRSTFLSGVPGANRARAGFQGLENLAGVGTEETPDESMQVQREGVARMEKDHPGAALALELTSGSVLPLGPLKAAAGASKAVRLAKGAANLTLGGALQGVSSADLRGENVAGGAAKGAGTALVAAPLIHGVASGGKTLASFFRQPNAEEATLAKLGDLAAERGGTGDVSTEIAARRSAGGEPMAFEVLGDRGARSLRAAKNAPFSKAGEVAREALGARSGEAAQRADAAVLQGAGIGSEEPGAVVDRMVAERTNAARPHFQTGEAEGAAGGSPAFEQRVETALELPRIQNEIKILRRDARWKDVDVEDHGLLTEVYRRLNEDLRAKIETKATDEARDLSSSLGVLRDAIGERAPAWLEGNRVFTEASIPVNSFDVGKGFREYAPYDIKKIIGTGKLPNGSPVEPAAFKAGVAQDLREIISSKAPSASLEGAATAKNPLTGLNSAQLDAQLKAALGPGYDAMLPTFREILKEEAAKQAVLGGSNTAAQLADEVPDITGTVLSHLAGGIGFGAKAASRRGVLSALGETVEKSGLRGAGKVATEQARALTSRGQTLDDLIRKLGERAKVPIPTTGADTGTLSAIVRALSDRAARTPSPQPTAP